ncbi:hypothetical protein CDD81_6591 [Ophiocordyceps australis]|uniref:Frequency clock protein n=1 Tax=Ophiocordyceps australis TaxID=1399860 RepID=A0A2C5Y5H6_9HYPO|nr:hypothetical protein CDD81_6591 [Ophiocordyceps australis]
MPITTDNQTTSLQPPPRPTQRITHPLPRRSSPANSVTLRHHRLTREACLRANQSLAAYNCNNVTTSPRRNSSGDSHETGQSDPKNWFDQSNQNPTATYDTDANAMDVDPPFFQKESDSSNEDKVDSFQMLPIQPKLTVAHSSSADDYRSVIDDLTIEIQKLKDELKRYKQKGPDLLRKDKLFEIKIHGLPNRKKRELEATLREFAASLGDSPNTTTTRRQGDAKHANRDHMYSGAGSASKHASSSSGSNARPVDSAYASMSTGANSSMGTSLSRPPLSSRKKSAEQKVENYLRDIPEGLYPRHMSMSEKERKKMVVRRLEQLFTGKIGGRHMKRSQHAPPPRAGTSVPLVSASAQSCPLAPQPPAPVSNEPSREAKILSTDQQSGQSTKNGGSRDLASAANSNEEQTDLAGNGRTTNTGSNKSPPMVPPPAEQRPTRLKDLDPDRVQVPSENMEYIRHLGLVPPEILADQKARTSMNVCTDADGWVYLNLLCNLAQLHMINVTPSFVRSAVCEMSTMFQLSPDGRRIRWRGGDEGTRFTSDSSGDNSQRSPDTDDTSSSNIETSRKRQKTNNSIGVRSGSSGKNPYKFGPQVYNSSSGFHYKPLFAQHEMLIGQPSPEETLSSFGPAEGSGQDVSRWDHSGSGTSNRRKRRHDGAIIYYSGAPFCTDLSGDPGDVSPTTYMLSSGQEQPETKQVDTRPRPHRSESGSSLCYRPLIDTSAVRANLRIDTDDGDAIPELVTDSGDDSGDADIDLCWTHEQQYIDALAMEPTGLGGVLPEDHFMVVVTTKRPKLESQSRASSVERDNANVNEDSLASHAATTITTTEPPSGLPSKGETLGSNNASLLRIEYISGRIKRLPPVSLPPPALFLPPFSSDGSSDGDETDCEETDCDDESSEARISRKVNPHSSDGYPDGVDLSSGDEDGEDPDDEPNTDRMYARSGGPSKANQLDIDGAGHSISSAEAAPGTHRGCSKSASDA